MFNWSNDSPSTLNISQNQSEYQRASTRLSGFQWAVYLQVTKKPKGNVTGFFTVVQPLTKQLCQEECWISFFFNFQETKLSQNKHISIFVYLSKKGFFLHYFCIKCLLMNSIFRTLVYSQWRKNPVLLTPWCWWVKRLERAHYKSCSDKNFQPSILASDKLYMQTGDTVFIQIFKFSFSKVPLCALTV